MRRLAIAWAFALPATALAQGAVLQPDPTPVLQPAGLQGLLAPRYDRVSGLSLPVGATLRLASDRVVIAPALAYRSRLGVIDPSVTLLVGDAKGVRLEADAARSTRTNDAWNYSDLVNSATTLFAGNDTRNYFRSNGGEGRVFAHVESDGLVLEPFLGGRYERVSAISAGGNVWSVTGRHSDERIRRPNPLVDQGAIGSALLGASMRDSAGPVLSRARIEVERSLSTFQGTSPFTQVTLDARVEFPTFKTQRLHVRAHAVGTAGDSVPRARYAYLGGSGTLPVVELEEFGGAELLFVESRYIIPIESVILPIIGVPVLTIRHIMGSAGVKSLPSLEQEVGAGIGLSVLRIDITTDAARKRGTKLGFGISLND